MSPSSSPATLETDINSATSPSETNAIFVTLKSDKTKTSVRSSIPVPLSVSSTPASCSRIISRYQISTNCYDSPSLTVHLLLVVFCTNTLILTLSSHAQPAIPSASYSLRWIARLKLFLDTHGCTSTICRLIGQCT